MTRFSASALLPVFGLCIVALTCPGAWATEPAAAATPPPTRQLIVKSTHFGETLVDPYQWLEDAADPRTQEWTVAQNQFSQAYFDRLPARQKMVEAFREMIAGKTLSYRDFAFGGSYVFAVRAEPPQPQPTIVRRSLTDLNRPEELVFDPNQFDRSGRTAFDWYQPSPDGSIVALSLSRDGNENGDLHFLRASDAVLLDEHVPNVQFATGGGSAAWDREGKGVFYTRYPREGERPASDLHFFQQVYYHALGTPEAHDQYAIGKEFPKIAEVTLQRSPGGRWILASVANGDGGQYAHYLRDEHGGWMQITRFEEGVKEVAFGGDAALFLQKAAGESRGEVWRLDLAAEPPDPGAKRLVVPESRDSAIQGIAAITNVLLVNAIAGGPSHLRRFDWKGGAKGEVSIPQYSAVTGLASNGADRMLVTVSSYTRPLRQEFLVPSDGSLQQTPFDSRSGVSFDDIETHRFFARSKDGTPVPVTVLSPKGIALNGTNPTILYGYGGYGLSSVPGFDPYLRAWFDRGGIFAVAHVRGGGEYGEPWHRAGMLEKKQNTLDDFAACAQGLIQANYTDSAHLGVWGISNGGITAGGLITQHPALVRAAVLQVGVLDVVRSEREPNGVFNTTEYGSVDDPVHYRAIRAYSPYQNVRDQAPYPAVLLLAGENDHRVASWHAKKMTARLQAATSSAWPVLLRTSATAGHGMGTGYDERLQQQADILSFFADQLQAKPKSSPKANPAE